MSVFISFSWSIGRMFWFLPSWLYFLSLWDIVPILAYVLAFALLESLMVLGLLLILAFLLPPRYLREKFTTKGVLMAVMFGLTSILFHRFLSIAYPWSPRQIVVYSALVVSAVVFLALVISYISVHRFARFEKLVTALAERISIFFYIYVPLGVVSLIMVVIRNIF
jgi:hypothetical protein